MGEKIIFKRKYYEISASDKLFKLRKKIKNLNFQVSQQSQELDQMVQLFITQHRIKQIDTKSGDIYLVDSGGQYEFGTTDVTRTISLNNTDRRTKEIFTRVLKGHIAVANFKLKSNTSGSMIDYRARKYLKEIGLDYSHGTGHGVGYFLNVHEGPQAISKK